MQTNFFRTKFIARILWNWKQNINHYFICISLVSNFNLARTDQQTLQCTLSTVTYQQPSSVLLHPASAEAEKSNQVLWGWYILECTLKAYPPFAEAAYSIPRTRFVWSLMWFYTKCVPCGLCCDSLHILYVIFNGKCAESKAMLFQFTVTCCHSDFLKNICD